MNEISVILSAFLDEGVPVEGIKDLKEQLIAGQAAGLKYWTPRFIYNPAAGGNVNVLLLPDAEIKDLIKASGDAGFKIGCLGTALGKVKLVDSEDGNRAPYKTHEAHMKDLMRGIEVARMTGAKFLRGFSFYPPRGGKIGDYFQQALDRMAPMAGACEKAGIIYLIEPEPGLTGYSSENMLKLCKGVNSPYLLIATDAANSLVQGLDAFQEYKAVAGARRLGLMHIKDYTRPCPKAIAVDEEALRFFGPVDAGIAGHKKIFEDLKVRLGGIDEMLKGMGAPGLILDVEGHMKGGGQFGGWSGPDGLGVAVRALTRMLDDVGIGYLRREYGDIKKK